MQIKFKRLIKVSHAFGLVLLILFFNPLPAQAFLASCKNILPTPQTLAKAHDLAAITADTLDDLDNVNLVIIARSGQDLSKYGLHHSHLAFLLRSKEGNWQAIHLLNQCNSQHSFLYREGLVNFIEDTSSDPNGLRIGVLKPSLQQAVINLLTEPASQVRFLHQKNYSAVAYPWGISLQNSNQWVLEVMAAAMALNDENLILSNRQKSVTWLQDHGYSPSRLSFNILKRLGAALFIKNISVADHPLSERISGNYSVVTVESIFDFLQTAKMLESDMIVVLEQ